MSETTHFSAWAATLQRRCDECARGRWSVRCLESCGSTQDEARTDTIGTVVAAWQQRAGRGRHGRAWQDTGVDGVAMTAVVECAGAAHLSVAAGLAVAMALEEIVPDGRERVRVKWPNDVQIDGLKVAGTLIEVVDDRALIGIGVNVSQRAWPTELHGVAISVAEAGAVVDRIDVMARILDRLDHALGAPREWLSSEFTARDGLRGSHRRIRVGDIVHAGTVRSIDPFAAIDLELADGTVLALPVALAALA